MFDNQREYIERLITRMIYRLPQRRAPENQFTNFMLARVRARYLKSFAQPDKPGLFWVRGHTVATLHGRVIECDCKSFRYRVTCKHAERVNMRLATLARAVA